MKLFHFLDTVVEVILQGNKEKAIGSENLKYVLLLSFEKETNPFLLMLRSALNRNKSMKDEGKEKASECGGVFIQRLHPQPSPAKTQRSAGLSKCILFSQGCAS